MFHSKQIEVQRLIEFNAPVLLEGPSGSGKTSILMAAAKNAGVKYSFISGTRQTTLSQIVGYMNVNGDYCPSPFRTAYVEGHYFNIDEIDAMDSNVLLVFNSLENKTMAFPDGYNAPPHENFRLMATANPQNQHDQYTGRGKLDAATLDRFDQIDIERDPDLEKSLVDKETLKVMGVLRQALLDANATKTVSMRDSMRYQKRKDMDLTEGFIKKLTNNNILVMNRFHQGMKAASEAEASEAAKNDVSKCNSLTELINLMESRI